MPLNSEQLEESALKTLKIAADWQQKNNFGMEFSCLSSAVSSFLGSSVARFDEPASGIDYLLSHNIGSLIRRMSALNNDFYQLLIKSGKPTIGSNVSNQIIFVHTSWLVGEWDADGVLFKICIDKFVAGFFPLTKFWTEYHRAIECLSKKEPYVPVILKLRGYEKYWEPYLKLIIALTHSGDLSAAHTEISDSFLKRNRDKRLIDWQMIDGDGSRPVKWDFRETSILKYWEYICPPGTSSNRDTSSS